MNQTNLPKKLLSLGIPTYKRPEYAVRLIKKAISMNIYDEIIVSSNSKEEILTDFVNSKESCSKVKFFQQKENVGLALNYLKLIELCDSEYLHILSDEDLPNEKNIQKLYEKLASIDSRSIIITSVANKDGSLYKDASWQHNDSLKDLLGETAHIGSCLINNAMMEIPEMKALSEYCKREGSVYVGPAAALIAYSIGNNLLYFSPATVEMGELHDVREISGYQVYGFKPRLDQYLNLFILWKTLKLRNKFTIYFYMLFYFSHHALHNAKGKFNESPTEVFLNFIKYNKPPFSSLSALFALYVGFYIFHIYFISRSSLSRLLKGMKS